MSKKIQMYEMSIAELLAKPTLLDIMIDSHAVEDLRFESKSPKLYWNTYYFIDDGETWKFMRQFYAERDMTCFPGVFELHGGKYSNIKHPGQNFTYDELTELITSEIPKIPNLNSDK